MQSRTHAEGESESAYEGSTRVFENRNDCHAVTYFAYQLVKQQTLKFTVKSVLRRVVDAAGDSRVDARPIRPATSVGVIPSGVLATRENRLQIETIGRTSAAAQQANLVSTSGGGGTAGSGFLALGTVAAPLRSAAVLAAARTKPLAEAQRDAALKAVDADLVKAGVIDKVGGDISPRFRAELSFERVTCLPTQSVVVKGCLDVCNVCEDARKKAIELDLKRKDLENKMLEKQIEILEKSQEYRCCPAGETEDEDD